MLLCQICVSCSSRGTDFSLLNTMFGELGVAVCCSFEMLYAAYFYPLLWFCGCVMRCASSRYWPAPNRLEHRNKNENCRKTETLLLITTKYSIERSSLWPCIQVDTSTARRCWQATHQNCWFDWQLTPVSHREDLSLNPTHAFT